MKICLFALVLALTTLTVQAQTSYRAVLRDSLSGEALVGVSIGLRGTALGGLTDATGTVTLERIPDGRQTLVFSFVGYQKKSLQLTFPVGDTLQTVRLALETAALDEVTVTATRTNSRIEDLPIKVEVLGQEDMDEESTMVPGNVSSILGDISIIHIQRTSLTTGNQGIRMQGLDAKYTQILRDGLPLYEGFSGNLGVLQIPPLDLKQVEVVKGSASTLYGGGAIGGLINLVSRRPGAEPEFTAVLNRSNLRETNANAYFSKQFSEKVGTTVFAGYTNQPAVDVNGDGFSDAPLIQQFTLHPRLFLTPNAKTRLNLGYTFVTEKRAGGDEDAIGQATGLHTYVVKNDLQRHTADGTFDHTFAENHTFTARGTASFFDRTELNNGYRFAGKQFSGYAEATDFIQRGAHTFVGGANLTVERFRKGTTDSSRLGDFDYTTLGVFGQDDWKLGEKVTLQGGLRLDHHNVFGNFLLPRLSLLLKPAAAWSVRTSVGTGYKTPNVFANLTSADLPTNSRLSYRYLLPLAPDVKPERSLGLNMDVAYKGAIGEHFTLQLDQAFYYTVVHDPIVAVSTDGSASRRTQLRNATYDLRSLGTDTYLRMEYDDLELYLGYNHTSAKRRGASDNTFLPYSPQDKFSLTMAYSFPGKWRFGIESSWVGNQYLYNNQRVPNYWFWAAAVERKFEPLSLVLNVENLFNVRQSDYGPVVTGPLDNPTIAPIWAPQEGLIVNVALKYQLRH